MRIDVWILSERINKVWEATDSYFYSDSIYCISLFYYSLNTRLILGLKAIPVGFLQFWLYVLDESAFKPL